MQQVSVARSVFAWFKNLHNAVKAKYAAKKQGRLNGETMPSPFLRRHKSKNALSLGPLVSESGTVYDRQEVIGYGGMSIVYKGRRSDGQLFAIKQLAPGSLVSERRWLRREASILSKLDNRHIVKLLDYGTSLKGQLYLALEWINGKTLEQVLRRNHLTTKRALTICLQIARTMDYIHKSGIVHRDLKPANVMLTDLNKQDWVHIVDFGIASIKEKPGAVEPPDESGSLLYMSPEQIWAHPFNEKSDIYQFGLVLFECLTGYLPFEETVAAAMAYRTIGPLLPAKLKLSPAHLEHDLRTLLQRLLARDPDERPESMALVAHKIEQLLERLDQPQLLQADIPVMHSVAA